MLMPALVLPMLTEEQTRSVTARAWGMAAISSRSPAEKPFCTRAEKPPMKLTPTVWAARSRVLAYSTGSPPDTAASMAMGVTAIRLLMMGMPYWASMASPTATRFLAFWVILSYTFWQERARSLSAQSSSEMPMVMVRISRFSSWIMRMVSRMSLVLSKLSVPSKSLAGGPV